jgi:hypothetical protein
MKRQAFALAVVATALMLLTACGSTTERLPGEPREHGDLYVCATVTFLSAQPPDRVDVLKCPDEWTDENPADGCPDDLGEFDSTSETGLSFCADYLALGGLVDPEEDGIVDITIEGQDEANHLISVTFYGLDTNVYDPDVGFTGTVTFDDPCDSRGFFNMDLYCGAVCDGEELMLHSDDQPDPCDGSVTWGSGDTATVTELTIAPNDEGDPRILENSAAAGTFSFTARNALPDGTWSQVEVTGEFRVVVGAFSWVVGPDDGLICDPC